MSKYLEKQIRWFEDIERERTASKSDRHRTILRNYILHAAYELIGEPERLLGPELMVDEPCYIILGLGEDALRVFNGKEAVKRQFYDQLNEGLVLVYDETRLVHDWGLAMVATVSQIVNGSQLAGQPGIDPNGRYIIEHRCAERWPFDDTGRVAGEEVYQIGEAVISAVDPDDDVTVDERNDAIRRFLTVA